MNSPASAGRKPSSLPSAASTAAMTARPPCTCSSAMSSPVSLFGPGNQSARASSMTSPLAGLRTRANAARRGCGMRPISLLQREAGARARDAHHRDRRRRPAGGQSEDGVAVGGHALGRMPNAPSQDPFRSTVNIIGEYRLQVAALMQDAHDLHRRRSDLEKDHIGMNEHRSLPDINSSRALPGSARVRVRSAARPTSRRYLSAILAEALDVKYAEISNRSAPLRPTK